VVGRPVDGPPVVGRPVVGPPVDGPPVIGRPVIGRPTRHSGRVRLVMTIAVFASYTAAEAGLIAWGYTYLIFDRGVSHGLAAVAIAVFWAALTAGRFGLALVDDRLAGTKVLEASCLLMIAGTALFWALPGGLAIIGLPVAGFGSAAVFPTLVALMPARVGEATTGHVVGLAVATASFSGPAAVAVFGVLAAHLGVGALGVCLFASTLILYAVNHVLTRATAEGAS
jgi:fucose permease